MQTTNGMRLSAPQKPRRKLVHSKNSPRLSKECMHVQPLSHSRLFVTPQTVACQAPLSMEFFRQDYWSGLPFPAPGDLPDPEIEPMSLPSSALEKDRTQVSHIAGRFFTSWATREAQEYWGGSSLLQRIFLTQESNQGLLHCRWILYHWATGEAENTVVIILYASGSWTTWLWTAWVHL